MVCKFPAGDFLLDDAPRSGRPAEVESGPVETLTENNQHCTTRERADILKILKSIVIGETEKMCFLFYGKN